MSCRISAAVAAFAVMTCGLTAAPTRAHARPGFASAGAQSLLVVGATYERIDADVAGATERIGARLDLDGGDRGGPLGVTWGLVLGFDQQGTDAVGQLGDGKLHFPTRGGFASSVRAWNRVWPGELLLTADLHVAYGDNVWWADGLRVAPRLGLRVLLGYGLPVRMRLRVDIAPAVFAVAPDGLDTAASTARVRLGIDVGGFTLGVWAMAAQVQARRTNSDVGNAWAKADELGVGIAIGLRRGVRR